MRNFEANNVNFIFGTVFNIAFVASMQQSNLESRNFKLVERSVSDAETTVYLLYKMAAKPKIDLSFPALNGTLLSGRG